MSRNQLLKGPLPHPQNTPASPRGGPPGFRGLPVPVRLAGARNRSRSSGESTAAKSQAQTRFVLFGFCSLSFYENSAAFQRQPPGTLRASSDGSGSPRAPPFPPRPPAARRFLPLPLPLPPAARGLLRLSGGPACCLQCQGAVLTLGLPPPQPRRRGGLPEAVPGPPWAAQGGGRARDGSDLARPPSGGSGRLFASWRRTRRHQQRRDTCEPRESNVSLFLGLPAVPRSSFSFPRSGTTSFTSQFIGEQVRTCEFI